MKALVGIIVGIGIATAGLAAEGPDRQTWEAVAGKAAKFLKSTQEPNGGWSTAKSPGVTGIALTGLLKAGETTAKRPRR